MENKTGIHMRHIRKELTLEEAAHLDRVIKEKVARAFQRGFEQGYRHHLNQTKKRSAA